MAKLNRYGLNDERCQLYHMPFVIQSHIDTSGKLLRPSGALNYTPELEPCDYLFRKGQQVLITVAVMYCHFSAETLPREIVSPKNWSLLHIKQTGYPVTAVYRIHAPEYLQPSIKPNHS